MLCLVMQPVLSFRQDGASHWQMRQPGVIRPVFLEERKVMLSYVMLHCWGRAAGVFSEFLLKCHDAWFSLARFSLAMSGLCSSAPCGGGAMWGWLALLLFLPSTVTMTLFWCKVISRENSGLNRNTWKMKKLTRHGRARNIWVRSPTLFGVSILFFFVFCVTVILVKQASITAAQLLTCSWCMLMPRFISLAEVCAFISLPDDRRRSTLLAYSNCSTSADGFQSAVVLRQRSFDFHRSK